MIYVKQILLTLTTIITLMLVPAGKTEQQSFHPTSNIFEINFLPNLDPPKTDPTIKDLPQITCMAVTMYGEAKGTSDKSLLSVAYVIVNRAKHPKFPNNTCKVVLQPGQMNPIETDKKLRSLVKQADKGQVKPSTAKQYAHYIKIAKQAFYKQKPDPTHGATHFYSPKLVEQYGYQVPSWAYSYTYTTSLAGHRYYKM